MTLNFELVQSSVINDNLIEPKLKKLVLVYTKYYNYKINTIFFIKFNSWNLKI